MRPGRRRFLQVGIAGTAVLATAGWLSRPRGGVVEALVPVVLEGSLPASGAERARAVRDVTEAFHRAVGGLTPAVQAEVGQLLALLRWMPTRLAFTGVASPLDEAAPGDVAAFLSRWRESRFDLLRAGYQALTQLIQAAWYDNPASWAAIGYPGPPPGVRA
jgi:hypothetical protein